MSIPALESSIEGDLAEGRIPVMVVATAGTTSAGVIDPLQECADVAGRQNLWYHVDAAWAGAALVSDRLRSAITGIASADSITMDAHKWLATTMGCGMFLIRQPSVLSTVFGIAATYMPSRELSRDPYMNSVQWSRRFLGLRLFLALACVGWRGYADHVERAVSQAARIAQRLCALGWHVLNDSPVAVLAVTPPPELGDPRVIVRRVLESGRAWVSIAQFESRDVIRICVTNGETSDEDISCLIKALNAREPGI